MEMKATVKTLKQNRALIVGVSGDRASWIARECYEFLYVGVAREGSPFELKPRTSVLAQMYVLDALSIELQARKNITKDEFLAWHPAGSIGQDALAKLQWLR